MKYFRGITVLIRRNRTKNRKTERGVNIDNMKS